jgi:hypothetical protein
MYCRYILPATGDLLSRAQTGLSAARTLTIAHRRRSVRIRLGILIRNRVHRRRAALLDPATPAVDRARGAVPRGDRRLPRLTHRVAMAAAAVRAGRCPPATIAARDASLPQQRLPVARHRAISCGHRPRAEGRNHPSAASPVLSTARDAGVRTPLISRSRSSLRPRRILRRRRFASGPGPPPCCPIAAPPPPLSLLSSPREPSWGGSLSSRPRADRQHAPPRWLSRG